MEAGGGRGRTRPADSRGEGAAAAREEAVETEAPEQPAAEQPKEKKPRAERKPWVHQHLVTVACRGPLAGRFRELAEQHQMSLAKLMQDAVLAWESNVAAGYRPGAALAEWKAQRNREGAGV